MESSVRHLYVHVPFCPAKCSYCAFVTHVGSLKLLPAYIQALMADASAEATAGRVGPLDTIYFGGGTPSMMEPSDARTLLAHFDSVFGLANECEVSLEAHPSTVDAAKLAGFRAAGVTRISFGVESLQTSELAAVGRRYAPESIPSLIAACRTAGFNQVALDLIYGLPGQSLHSWRDTLDRAIDTGVDHLSLYPLSIEPRTVFARQWREGRLALPTDEAVIEMYSLACQVLQRSGFVHYEVANWAKPMACCRHNLAYWHNREYCAIGVGAHAYIKPWRTERLTSTRQYIDIMASTKDPVARREFIDRDIELHETIMLRLRLLQQGVDFERLEAKFNTPLRPSRAQALETLIHRGLIESSNDAVRLTERGVPVANEVFAALM